MITQPVDNIPVGLKNRVHVCYVTFIINRIIVFPSIAGWLPANTVVRGVLTTSDCQTHQQPAIKLESLQRRL